MDLKQSSQVLIRKPQNSGLNSSIPRKFRGYHLWSPMLPKERFLTRPAAKGANSKYETLLRQLLSVPPQLGLQF